MPYWKNALLITENIKKYLEKIQNCYNNLFQVQSTPFDRTLYYVDDHLLFQDIDIGNKAKGSIYMKLLLTPIGVSRVLSFSMFIHPIICLKEFLVLDQILQISFIASLLNTPVRFYYTIMELVKKAKNDNFIFQDHPFYDWLEETMKYFDT